MDTWLAMLKKIISGGQTGVDLAALDSAIKHGISCGGWCASGRINEQGCIPEKYNFLTEVTGVFNSEKRELRYAHEI